MTLKSILLSGFGAAVLTVPAVADDTNFPNQVHDIIVTSNIPAVNISVRNMSNSTDPADRDLRMISDSPVIDVTGQVWCNSYDSAENNARRAQIMFGNPSLNNAGIGNTVVNIGVWSQSDQQNFNGQHALENFELSAPMNLPTSWDSNAAVTLGFNPVQYVEERLEAFVNNNAGSEADFLRVDDVFEAQATMNAVGWCDYESQAFEGSYAGIRSIPVTIAIFYHGDPDIQDVIQTVGGGDSLAAPVPSRARETVRTRGADTQPPARNPRPARARDDNTPQHSRTARRDELNKQMDKQRADRGNARNQTNDDATRARAGVEPDEIDAPAQARAGVEPDEIEARFSDDAARSEHMSFSYTPIHAENSGVEPDEIDAPAQARAGVEPDEIDRQ